VLQVDELSLVGDEEGVEAEHLARAAHGVLDRHRGVEELPSRAVLP
jgi:hypothetical protein